MSEKESVSNIYVVKAVPVQQEVNLNESLLDEYVEVEEEYCGPVTTCCGILFFVLFWPLSLVVGCCPCDKRVVKKRVVKR